MMDVWLHVLTWEQPVKIVPMMISEYVLEKRYGTPERRTHPTTSKAAPVRPPKKYTGNDAIKS